MRVQFQKAGGWIPAEVLLVKENYPKRVVFFFIWANITDTHLISNNNFLRTVFSFHVLFKGQPHKCSTDLRNMKGGLLQTMNIITWPTFPVF